MRIAYFDCFSGISGDMILGALIDAGVSKEDLLTELKKLPLSNYDIVVSKTKKHEIEATQVNVKTEKEKKHRNLNDIIKIIDKSGFELNIKEKAKRIFTRLAEVEAKIHGLNIDQIHFHEVGAVDAIIDVVGAVVGLKLLKAEKIYCSRLTLGKGLVKCAHGTLSLPAPATGELLKGFPVKLTTIEAELVTPTGAAIITSLASFEEKIDLKIEKIGYGAGSMDLKQMPNLLRILVGTQEKTCEEDEVLVLETNLDNTTPEICGYLVEKLLSAGALDVYMTPVVMKKARPGILLSTIANPKDQNVLTSIIFAETGTIGIRGQRYFRKKLPRRIETIDTKYGKIKVKIITDGNKEYVAPEYEDCKRLAEEKNLPLKTIYEEVKKSFRPENKDG